MIMKRQVGKTVQEELIFYAISLGADDAKLLSAEHIVIKEEFVNYCRNCEGFGSGGYCPPHAMHPSEFREKLRQYSHGLIFKTDVPAEMLLSCKRHRYTRKIHETAARIERFARAKGFAHAMGLAAGSCKPLFCGEHESCRLLENRDGENRDMNVCRHPERARPSMSAYGIDVFHLGGKAGWDMKKITGLTHSEKVPTGILTGMVLI
jgi:predicted metal-binding protein